MASVSETTYPIAVLASGEGTILQAILDRLHGGAAGVEVVGVGSNVAGARALERARAASVRTSVFDASDQTDREARDVAMADWIASLGAELVVLAGYMQLVSPEFLARFPDRVINVHPALLPSFPGIGAIQQAIDEGVKTFGVTIHLVDEGVDSGSIILQRAIDLPGAVDADEVRNRLRPIEQDAMCEAIEHFASGAVRRDPGHPRRMLVGK